MSQNTDVILAGAEAWNRQDLDGFLARLTPDAEFVTSGVFPDFDPVYRGRDGIAEFWRRLHEPWDRLEVEIGQIEEHGNWVVYAFRFRAKGAGSGAGVDLRFANAAEFRGDRVARIVAHRDFQQARETALGGVSG